MTYQFDAAFEHVLKWEGGYVNDPHDPGGETKYGISKRAHPDVDVAGLTKAAAKEIYRQSYWHKSGCDKLSDGLDLMHFDTAVNMGVGAAEKLLAKSGGDLLDYAVARARRYAGLAGFERYGRGWLRRLFDTYGAAIKLGD